MTKHSDNKQKHWEIFQSLFKQVEIPAKTILLQEGKISKTMYFIEKGCLRTWVNNDGKEITTHFFLKEIVFLRLRVSEPNSQVYIASKALNPVFYKSFPRKIFNRLLKIHPNYKNNLKSIFLSDCSKPNSLPFPFSKTTLKNATKH